MTRKEFLEKLEKSNAKAKELRKRMRDLIHKAAEQNKTEENQ